MVCGCDRGRGVGVVLLGIVSGVGLAGAEPTIEREIIGRSPSGEPIVVWTVADHESTRKGPGAQPAIAVIAGVQGHHQIGVHVAEAMGELLLDEHGEALHGRTVYIIPRVNPEGIERFVSTEEPRALSGRVPESRDADRDRRRDEDPPNDLNGDGLITMMRVPAPQVTYGIEPTHVIDRDDSRLVREPDDDEGATHALLIEGLDDDGDGRFNEDGWGGASGGGIDLDMHFPMRWPEHADGAGRYPLERPEARSVVEWLQSRGNIAAVIVLGPHDTIITPPPSGRQGPDGRSPMGIEEDDVAVYEMVGDAFKEITSITKVEPGPELGGSLVHWCYADLGVYAFGTPVWVRPDLVKVESATADDKVDRGEEPEVDAEDAGPDAEQIEAADRADLSDRGVDSMFIDYLYMSPSERAGVQSEMESMRETEREDVMRRFAALPADVQARLSAIMGGGADPGPNDELLASIGAGSDGEGSGKDSGSGGGDSAGAKWLAWVDEHAPGGFIDWEPFEHPQLGSIEIGGFRPGVRVNPPEEDTSRLAAEQAEFAAALLGMLPELEYEGPVVERVGSGVWRVGLTLRNTGEMPTKSAIGVKARRLPGIICVLDPGQDLSADRIISGSRAIRFDAIGGRGDSGRAEWLVIADDGDTVDLEVRSPMFGTTRYTLTMEGE